MRRSSDNLGSGYLGETAPTDLSWSSIAQGAGSALSSSITSILSGQLTQIANQVRVKLANDQALATGVQVDPNSIPDLTVTEYLFQMPTASTNAVLSDKMTYIGKAAAFGLITGLGIIGISLLLPKLIKE